MSNENYNLNNNEEWVKPVRHVINPWLLIVDDVCLREVRVVFWSWQHPWLIPLQATLATYVFVTSGWQQFRVLFDGNVIKRRRAASQIALFAWLEAQMTRLTGLLPEQRILVQHRYLGTRRFLRQLQWYNSKHPSVSHIRQVRQAFMEECANPVDPAHSLSLCQSLWRNLKPQDAVPEKFPDSRWQELGFQGTDPESDLRSTGIASLKLLVGFAQTTPGKQTYQRSILIWYVYIVFLDNFFFVLCFCFFPHFQVSVGVCWNQHYGFFKRVARREPVPLD